jgi:hypothetical protein
VAILPGGEIQCCAQLFCFDTRGFWDKTKRFILSKNLGLSSLTKEQSIKKSQLQRDSRIIHFLLLWRKQCKKIARL